MMIKPKHKNLAALSVLLVIALSGLSFSYRVSISHSYSKQQQDREGQEARRKHGGLHRHHGEWWRGQTYKDSSTRHPHVGARHPNGTLGMIVDPSPSRLWLFDHTDIGSFRKFIDPCILCPAMLWGNNTHTANVRIEGEGGHLALLKIRDGIIKSRNQMATMKFNETKKRSRIMCIIYTVHTRTSDGTFDNPSVRAQSSTWGRQCDGFIAASNYTDHSVGAIDLPHMGKEEYGNMWQKLRSIWGYAYDHYLEEFDYFYVGGDDVYVAVDNLRAYVDGPEVARLQEGYLDEIAQVHAKAIVETPRPLVFGIPMNQQQMLFPSGGPGYTINRAALELLAEDGLPNFLPNATDSREDVFLGSFFWIRNVPLTNTQDPNGAFRYGASAESGIHYEGVSPISPNTLFARYKIEIPLGLDSVSEQQIGFHLKDDKEMLSQLNCSISELIYRYHAVLNDWCIDVT